jgi:hypothetical protein
MDTKNKPLLFTSVYDLIRNLFFSVLRQYITLNIEFLITGRPGTTDEFYFWMVIPGCYYCRKFFFVQRKGKFEFSTMVLDPLRKLKKIFFFDRLSRY